MRYSNVVAGNVVPFAAFTGDQIYMLPFERGILPSGFEQWQPTVDAMMNGRTNKAWLMVDQKGVHQGQHHRRPGVHVSDAPQS